MKFSKDQLEEKHDQIQLSSILASLKTLKCNLYPFNIVTYDNSLYLWNQIRDIIK